jgi:hypothetical protein
MNEQERANNPHNVCILRSDSECKECSLKTELDCHFDLKKLLRFGTVFFFIVISSAVALAFTGLMTEFWVYLIVLGVFSVIFFEFWEIRILCSHCPFYAENKGTIRCYGNFGSLKVWRYRPEPMSRSENIQLIIGFGILAGILIFPLVILVANAYYLWTVPVITGMLFFLYVVRKYHCPRCFNFSCHFNSQPKPVIDEFLRLNPVMRKAWEEHGWQM